MSSYNTGWDNNWDKNPRFKHEVSIEVVLEMNKNGMTQQEIANHFNVSRQVILNRFKKSGIKAINWRYKKGYYKHSNETRNKIGKSNKKHRKGKTWEEIYGSKKAAELKKIWRENQRKKCLGPENPIYKPGAIEKITQKAIERCKNPEYLRKILIFDSPNKSERFLLKLLTEHGYDYEFVGNGKVVIDGKCPDFIRKNRIVELFGERRHLPEEGVERKRFFEGRGYKTLIIWYKELNDIEGLLNKLEDFHNA